MDLVNRNKIAAMLAGGLLAALFAGAPARADDDTLFGQPAPKQFLLNKMFSPKSLGLTNSGGANGQTSGGANGQAAGAKGQTAGANGQVAGSEPKDEDDDGPGPFPKRYLLNRMFGQ